MEPLKHECGVVMIRLLKPLEYYQEKYGTWTYGLNKLYLLMEKQHNRGQEGAGLGVVKLGAKVGEEYMFRERAEGTGAISEIFAKVHQSIAESKGTSTPYAGEALMGHLRYSTAGHRGLSFVHPFLRRSNWRDKNLAICGNFSLTNTDEVFNLIATEGQHPRHIADAFVILEQLGALLDSENERNINLAHVLSQASRHWDGGYVMCGMTGCGEQFTIRDPWGIRTAFYYQDDEIVVVASERPVIQTALNVPIDQVHELQPGEALLVGENGDINLCKINVPQTQRTCSFERIYFSRGSDRDIYNERKMLGKTLVDPILKSVNYDIDHTVFSFIPNTAEVAYYGMLEGFEEYLNNEKIKQIAACDEKPSSEELHRILSKRIRSEKVALKDIKLRTFISEGKTRNDLATHVYDITYGSIVAGEDNLVVIDDSIVRGTTLKQSIISILNRLQPKKIVIVSSSPQVRYPDYYGIDMASLDQFIAFRAAIALLHERGMSHIIDEVYKKSKAQESLPKEQIVNYVKEIYAPFTDEELNHKMVEMLKPDNVDTEIELVYQTLDGLHKACPNHLGDWYFSGDFPTAGGMKLVNKAFIDYIENK